MSEVSIKIEVEGHPARITEIYASHQHDFAKGNVEVFGVWVEFDEPVNGTKAVAVDIPVGEYSRKQFVREVVERAEECLCKLRIGKREEKEREARFQCLKDRVEELKKKIGLVEKKKEKGGE